MTETQYRTHWTCLGISLQFILLSQVILDRGGRMDYVANWHIANVTEAFRVVQAEQQCLLSSIILRSGYKYIRGRFFVQYPATRKFTTNYHYLEVFSQTSLNRKTTFTFIVLLIFSTHIFISKQKLVAMWCVFVCLASIRCFRNELLQKAFLCCIKNLFVFIQIVAERK